MKDSFRALMSATALLLSALALPAVAADYEPPVVVDQGVDEVPVEVGSGWYLRGDVGYAFNSAYEVNESPSGLSTKNKAWSGSIGMGYHFTDYFRAEVDLGILPSGEFDRRYTTTCEGTETYSIITDGGTVVEGTRPGERPCEGFDSGDNTAYNFMAKGFVDLGTYVGLTPYVGGGVGVAYSSYKLSEDARDCNNSTNFECYDPSFYEGTQSRERQYNFSYALGAGVAYEIAKNVQLDLGYEYVAVPSAKFINVDNAGNPYVDEGVDFHQVKLGLRYDLW